MYELTLYKPFPNGLFFDIGSPAVPHVTVLLSGWDRADATLKDQLQLQAPETSWWNYSTLIVGY